MPDERWLPVTFGIVVLNGEPFIRYQLEALYQYAARIVVVEGAVRAAAAVATADGHSIDGTLAAVKRFKETSDPEDKVDLVTAETEGQPDGFWSEKTAMSQAYARRAGDGWLWQIDVDEFYQPEDMEKLLVLLGERDSVAAVSFVEYGFWGGSGYTVDGYAFRTHDHMLHRLFRWRAGYSYAEHRPPKVLDEEGRDLKSRGWLTSRDTAALGIRVYHYDMLLPIQAERKSAYYAAASWHGYGAQTFETWRRETWEALRHPFWIYTLGDNFSWLRRFEGCHPPVVERMLKDVKAGRWPGLQLRPTADIEAMLRGRAYRYGLPFVRMATAVEVWLHWAKMAFRSQLVSLGLWRLIGKVRNLTRRGNA